MRYLTEVTRLQMIQAAKSQSPDRFARRLNYNVKSFKDVDFEQLFRDDTFFWYAGIGDHMVIIEFDGAFEELKWLVKGMKGPNKINRLTQEIVNKAISVAVDEADLRVACSCPDFTYRMRYYCVHKGCCADPPSAGFDYRPRYKRTNKDDNKGYVCKHILAVLYGKRWIPMAAKAWLDWMKSNPKLTAEYLFDEKWVDKKYSQSDEDKDGEE